MFKQNTYKDCEKQTTGKKACAAMIDYLFLVILTLLANTFIGYPIIMNNDNFQNAISSIEEEVVKLYDIQCETKLSIRETSTEILDYEETFQQYLNANIKTSYSYHSDLFNNDSITIEDLSDKATYENDILAYYFVTYKREKSISVEDYGELSEKEYFISIIDADESISSYYEKNGDNLPSLTYDVAKECYNYLKGNTSSSTVYDNLYVFFKSTDYKGLSELLNYSPYLESYNIYMDAYEVICNYESLALLLIYVVVILIAFILPQIFAGNGITLGRLITKTRVHRSANTAVSMALEGAMAFLINYSVILMVGMLSYSNVCFSFKLFGWFDSYLMGIISLALVLVSGIIMAFSKSKKTLTEILSMGTYVSCKVNKDIVEEIKEGEQNEEDKTGEQESNTVL